MPDVTNTPPVPETPAAGAPAAGGQAANPQPAAPGAADVQAQINAALAAQQADFAKQLQETTGHADLKSLAEANLKAQGKLQELADAKTQEAQTFKAKYEQTLIGNALLSAAGAAVDPNDVVAALAGKGVVDASGNVTIDGKPVAEAVKALLDTKPHWAKAQGSAGSGAPPVGGVAADKPQQDYQAAAKSRDVLGMLKLNSGAKS